MGVGDELGWRGEGVLRGVIPEANCWLVSSFTTASGVACTIILELSSDLSIDFVPRPAFRLFEGVDDST